MSRTVTAEHALLCGECGDVLDNVDCEQWECGECGLSYWRSGRMTYEAEKGADDE